MAIVLGISAFYHDSAAALIIDGKIITAVQEERFTRIKHTEVFPTKSIDYCLKENKINIDDLDAIVFYDKPFLKFERLLETYYAFSPKGLLSFIKAIPVWLNEKIFIKKNIYDGLKTVGDYDKKKLKLLFSEHHLSHAASAFYASPYNDAAILTIDGVGEWSTASISIGKGNTISVLKELHFPHSVGLLYSAFTYYLGFKVNSGEYKLMGLAPYGNPDSEQTVAFISKIKNHLVDIKTDGSIWLNQAYFNYATGLRMAKDKKWATLFGFPRKKEESDPEQHHCNLALAIQTVTEDIVLKMAQETKNMTQQENLCLTGGVALNCVANGKLIAQSIFKNTYIQPASGDAGGALGAALAIDYMYFNTKRNTIPTSNNMQGSYLGPSFNDSVISKMNMQTNAIYTYYDSFDVLCSFTANKIATGNVIGWFQGKMEFGPRALGNRSILADPCNSEMQKKLNIKIKKREGFRPFAPAVLEEDTHLYFEPCTPTPYMLTTVNITDKYRTKTPDNYTDLSLWDKLYQTRSTFQSITHLDFSARVQTVSKNTNIRFWKLLSEMKKQTGHGMLINTSFNVRGEPIVCTPYDAYRCFMNTEMDYLVINNFVYTKKEQPDWQNTAKWQLKFAKD